MMLVILTASVLILLTSLCQIVDSFVLVDLHPAKRPGWMAAVSSSSSDHRRIQVWDNVLSIDGQRLLHETAAAHGLGHTLLKRHHHHSQQPQQPHATRLEDALDEILRQLDDHSPPRYVEYWSRQEWRHIEAHADVDEYRARQYDPNDTTTTTSNQFRYTTHGHVLYLQVGPAVRGPTCLFPDCQSGGDLASTNTNSDNMLCSVPAVAGRLLRFPGDWLHAVPRPTDLWLLPFVKGAPDYTSPEYQRSVVLFNTWSDEPPLGVAEHEDTHHHHHNDDDTIATTTPTTTTTLVHNAADWREQSFVLSNNNANADKAKIWLLGDLRRRQHALRTVPVYTDGDRLVQALHEPHQPYETPLSKTAPA